MKTEQVYDREKMEFVEKVIPSEKTEVVQFEQIACNPIWDDDLISKDDRTKLVKAGLVERESGFNFITARGVRLAVEKKILKSKC